MGNRWGINWIDASGSPCQARSKDTTMLTSGRRHQSAELSMPDSDGMPLIYSPLPEWGSILSLACWSWKEGCRKHYQRTSRWTIQWNPYHTYQSQGHSTPPTYNPKQTLICPYVPHRQKLCTAHRQIENLMASSLQAWSRTILPFGAYSSTWQSVRVEPAALP